MRALSWLGASLFVSLVVAGCGKTSGGPSGTGSDTEDFSDVSREDLAPRAAQIICESFGACCEKATYAFDVAGCKTKLGQELAEELAEEESPASTFDSATAATCLTALRDNTVCGESEDNDVCEHIFAGTRGAGETCTDNNDCKAPAGGDAYCDDELQGDVSTGQGVCHVEQPLPRARLGESCSSSCGAGFCDSAPTPAGPGDPLPRPTTNAACYRDQGLYCASDFTCRELQPEGNKCADSSECADGTFCDLAQSACSPRKPNGASCESDSHCVGGDCSSGVCQDLKPSAMQCASGLSFK